MQAAFKTQPRQFATVTAQSKQQGLLAGSGPTLIAPELLQLIGGGKTVAPPKTCPALPVGKW